MIVFWIVLRKLGLLHQIAEIIETHPFTWLANQAIRKRNADCEEKRIRHQADQEEERRHDKHVANQGLTVGEREAWSARGPGLLRFRQSGHRVLR